VKSGREGGAELKMMWDKIVKERETAEESLNR